MDYIRKTQSLGILPQVVTVTQGWSGWNDEGSIWKLPPADYETLLRKAKDFVATLPGDQLGGKMLLLDNWNEWSEGHYIAPHREYGFGYLDAVRRVFATTQESHVDLLPQDIGLGPYDAAHRVKAGAAGDAKNTALIPVPKLENDSYDWYARHEAVLKVKDRIDPEIIMIGDSITHFWSGEPKAHNQRGPQAWSRLFGQRRVLNLGFGWDRTQNVLWRLDHGEMDGLHPRYVVVNIGTNNFSGTSNARANTPAEVAEGVRAICARIRSKAPDTRIIVMGVLPRGAKANDPFRSKITELNRLLPELAKLPGITFLDVGAQLLRPNGELPAALADDFCHPTEQGYAIWAAALKPLLQDGKGN
jgi:lysophospholipase L1-like esterase